MKNFSWINCSKLLYLTLTWLSSDASFIFSIYLLVHAASEIDGRGHSAIQIRWMRRGSGASWFVTNDLVRRHYPPSTPPIRQLVSFTHRAISDMNHASSAISFSLIGRPRPLFPLRCYSRTWMDECHRRIIEQSGNREGRWRRASSSDRMPIFSFFKYVTVTNPYITQGKFSCCHGRENYLL